MIAKLKGLFDSAGDDWLIIDVGGVGYHVFASRRTLSGLPAVGNPIELQIETHVREDHIHLFGFKDITERDMFRLLQSVQGVGAKVALGILSVLSPDALTTAIAASDKTAICKANGVGPKLGQRIIMELKDKMASVAVSVAGLSDHGSISAGSKTVADAVSALQNLGYSASQAHTVAVGVNAALGANAKVEDVIRLSLKELSR